MANTKVRNLLLAQGYFEIPLLLSESKHFIVEVKLNGQLVYFIVDTGASHSCLNNQKMEDLGLSSSEADMVTVGIGSTEGMKVTMIDIEHLQVGNFHLHQYPMAVLDLSNINQVIKIGEHSVEGVIGADLLFRHAAMIDYEALKMFLKPKKKEED